MKPPIRPTLLALSAALFGAIGFLPAETLANRVDFGFSPPEWQTSICLPDDPQKTLVDRSGELLYHYGRGGREFATHIGIEVSAGATWTGQNLASARVPVVRTTYSLGELEIIQESFAVTRLVTPKPQPCPLKRIDQGGVNQNWAKPPAGVAEALANIAVNMGGSIHYELMVPPGAARKIALALCEGWWNEPGKRIEILQVEGAASKTIDTVADIGRNKAAAFWFDARDTNGDGKILINVNPSDLGSDKNTFINGLWVFDPNMATNSEALLAGELNGRAIARMSTPENTGPARNDLMLVHVTNHGSTVQDFRPLLVIDTTLAFRFQPEDQRAFINENEVVTSSLQMGGLDVPNTQDPSVKGLSDVRPPSRRVIQLENLTIQPGKSSVFYVLHSGGGRVVIQPKTVKEALGCREAADRYWQTAALPFGRVQLPDQGIQALVDSAIRNIWQAREIKNGLPVFQVGPTCYRGLWIVDGSFLLESAAMLGAGREARSGILYTLSQQKPSGAFEVLSPKFYKENGIVMWTCVRHAMLTQDKAWLNSVWPQLERSAGYVQELRKRSLQNETPLDDGLIPPGEIDGGLSGQASGFKRPEFSNVHWNLLGLRSLIQAAHWLGREDSAAIWQKEYDDFHNTFRKAALRDTLLDAQGNAYVPIFMANEGHELPQRAQWTFCHAVYPGQIFAREDPLVTTTMAMLAATEREGMVYGTGWDATGIWNYFASFYAHSWLWQGDGRKAAQILYAYANHASPTLVWREEQSLKGEKFKKVGDMPHNWASAEFIRLVLHLLALDRGSELHLFEGLPVEWMAPGMVTKLEGIATPFGSLRMELKIMRDGRSARFHIAPMSDGSCRKIILHIGPSPIELDPKKSHHITIPLPSRG